MPLSLASIFKISTANMNKIIPIFLILTIFSCHSDRKQWRELKDNCKFSTVFEFALNNRESIYLDSAIVIMNDSLSYDKNFFLRIYDDSIVYIKIDNSINYKLSKRKVILYNISKDALTYIDSIYTSPFLIDSIISNFIKITKKWGGFYIYSDTLLEKNDWKKLFCTIDKIKSAYQIERENYSQLKFDMNFKRLENFKKNEVITEIPIAIVVYFKNPFPPPPPMKNLEFNYIVPSVLDTLK
jgi:hypothetical protein